MVERRIGRIQPRSPNLTTPLHECAAELHPGCARSSMRTITGLRVAEAELSRFIAVQRSDPVTRSSHDVNGKKLELAVCLVACRLIRCCRLSRKRKYPRALKHGSFLYSRHQTGSRC